MQGSSGSGSSSGQSGARSLQQWDPAAQQMEWLRAGQTQNFFDTVGMDAFARLRPDLFSLSGTERRFYDPLTAGGGALGSAANQFMTPEEQQARQRGLSMYASAMDPAKTRDYYQQIVAPSVLNNAIASGQGRSGAATEALARGGTDLTYRLLQQTPMLAAGQQQLAGQPRSMMGQGFQLAGIPRELSMQDYLRLQGAAQGMLGGIPFVPAQSMTTSGQQRGAQDQKTTGWNFLGGYCWVADALYGEGSERARYARLWVSAGWRGRKADAFRWFYWRIGPRLAALIRRWPRLGVFFRPLFDYFARQGWCYAALKGIG